MREGDQMHLAFGFLIVFAWASYGYGRLVSKCCYGGKAVPVPYDIALGLATLNVFGGVLNALHLAFPAGFYLLGAIGVSLALFFVQRAVQSQGGWREILRAKSQTHPTFNQVLEWATSGLVLLMMAFFAWKLMPTGAVNIHDDFHTYLVRPIRMISTGSIGGNPFDPLGLDSLGTQAFFQAATLLFLPLRDVNGFDAVFCFGISGFLILALVRQLGLEPWFGLLAVLGFLFINPQYVNISPIYSGSLMIGGLLMASGFLAEDISNADFRTLMLRAAPIGLFAATLISLKVTLGFFAVVQVTVLFGGLLLVRVPWQRVLPAASTTGSVILLSILPWLMVTWPVYGKARELAAQHSAEASIASLYPSIAARSVGDLFSNHNLFYGGNQLQYNVVVAFILIATIIVFRRSFRVETDQKSIVVFAIASGGLPVPIVYLLNAHLFDPGTAVRYSCPLLIGVFPVAALLAAKYASGWVIKSPRPLLSGLPTLSVALAQILLLLTFLPTFTKRVSQTFHARTLLSFPIDQGLLDFNNYAFSPATADSIRKIQEKIRTGETVLVWTAMPFHLDFQRNNILAASGAGLINPWLGFPAGTPKDGLQQYLRSWGIRYVLLEVSGFAETIAALAPMRRWPVYRKFTDYSTYTMETLLTLGEQSFVVHQDERTILLDLGDGNNGAPTISALPKHRR
jgi:hypothetical protein